MVDKDQQPCFVKKAGCYALIFFLKNGEKPELLMLCVGPLSEKSGVGTISEKK
ncbi:MAG: hypothetical protein JNL22_08335 [Bacteroidales bacterium]|nr:hypothetical protein [Bacteroidales bacterium]